MSAKKVEKTKLIKFELFEFSISSAHNRMKTMRGYGNFLTYIYNFLPPLLLIKETLPNNYRPKQILAFFCIFQVMPKIIECKMIAFMP